MPELVDGSAKNRPQSILANTKDADWLSDANIEAFMASIEVDQPVTV